MVNGYKCFNIDMTNRYGYQFEVGKVYRTFGDIEFGINGNGFHMCKNLVDVFRFYDTSNNDFVVCEVIGSGKIVTYDDEYNGYYDMYSVECIEIIRKLGREEIFNMVLNMNEYYVIRFIQLFRLNENEIIQLSDKFCKNISVLLAIDYYQRGKINVYQDYYNRDNIKRKVWNR